MNVLLQEFKDRIRVAAETHQTLSLQGHGSKAFFGETPQGDTLDVSGYSGVLSYEPSELVVTARAGTPLRELEALLAEKGQCLPFEPPHFGAAGGTLGGMVASGLSGPARVSVGSVRDYVLTNYRCARKRRIQLVYRGIEPDRYHPGHRPSAEWEATWRTRYPWLESKWLLLLPGRITRLKGHQDFLGMVAALAAATMPRKS